jgi:uncharacterized repeat protein (TIGR01451 family)
MNLTGCDNSMGRGTQMKKYLPVLATASLTLCAATAGADNHGIVVDVKAAKVAVEADGRQMLASVRDAGPGDVVEYHLTYRNTSSQRASNVIGTMKIPAHRLIYIPDSATLRNLYASVDGVKYSPVPLMRKVKRADGTETAELVPVSDYRYLRWQLGDLPAHGSTSVKARLRIDPEPVIIVTASVR